MSRIMEYSIRQDGKVFNRTIEEREVTVTDDVLSRISANTYVKVPDVMALNSVGKVGLAACNNNQYWSIKLPFLRLSAPFTMHTAGYLYPNFVSHTDPRLEMQWNKFADMELVLLVITNYSPAHKIKGLNPILFSNLYLVAVDKDRRFYKLPLPNVYDDCRVCYGNQEIKGQPTASDMLNFIFALFMSSPWNADLWKDAHKTQALFRFKPEGKVFNQMMPEQHWTTLCTKVATSHLNNIVI